MSRSVRLSVLIACAVALVSGIFGSPDVTGAAATAVPGKVVPDTSWKTSGATNFKYRKLADGSVEIRSTNTSAKSGTLASGYRPSESINLAVNSADSGPGDHFMSAIYITSAGVVTSASEEGNPTTGATVRFYADGS